MPTPKPNETRNQFVKRCVDVVITDGTTNDPKQAVAICNAYFDRYSSYKTKHDEKPNK